MIPYQVLIFLLTQSGSLDTVRKFLARRFNRPEKLEKFQNQLDHMIANLEAFDYLTRNEDDDTVSLSDGIRGLLEFRSVDPLYAAFLVKSLTIVSKDMRWPAKRFKST